MRNLTTDIKNVCVSRTVHNTLRQAKDRVNNDRAIGFQGIAAVRHTTRLGVNHSHNPHAHGHFVVGNPSIEAISHGGGAIFTSNNTLIGFDNMRGRDVQFRLKLPGKGTAVGVFANGATAHGKASVLGQAEVFNALFNGFGKLRGHFSFKDKLLNGFAHAKYVIEHGKIRDLHTPPNLFHKIVVREKHVKPMGGNHHPLGCGLAQLLGGLAKARHFPPHLVHAGIVGLLQGNNKV